MRGISSLACALALFGLAGCSGRSAPPAVAPAKAAASSEQVNRIVERYWDDRLPLENAIAPQYLADSLSIERRYLAEILGVEPNALDAQSKLTYDIFRRQREIAVE